MFYKFVGGDDEVLVDLFDKMVSEGSLKFGSASNFNDPFEFKFASQAPSRFEFDRWHAMYAPERTPNDLENAWASFSGPAKEWNTRLLPRCNLMSRTYILCLAQRFESHLMWAHYSGEHRGFSILYKQELISALRNFSEYEADDNVNYSDSIPHLRWFSGPPSEMAGRILFTKSRDWDYENEYRVILMENAGAQAIYRKIDPSLVSGIILGARAPEILIKRALETRSQRPDFTVEQISSDRESYSITAVRVDENRRTLTKNL